MRLGDRDDRADQAGRQWDAFVNGSRFFPSEPTADFSTTISRLHAGDDAPAVDPAFSERLFARLITGSTAEPHNASSTAQIQEGTFVEQTIDNHRPTRIRRRAPNLGHHPAQSPTRRVPGADPRRRIQSWVELPAMLVVLAILIGTVFFGRGPSLFNPDNNYGAVIPAAGTPAGLATPKPQPAEPVLMGQSRGNAARTGVYPGAGPVTAPEIVWQKEMPRARVNPSLVVDDGRVFLLKSPEGGSPLLWVFDLATGDELWTFSVEWTNNRMLAAADGRVYVSRGNQGNDELVALDAETGKEQWAHRVGISHSSTPAVYGNTVFVVGGNETLFAIDAITGEARWTFELTAGANANEEFSRDLQSPAVANGIVYAPAQGGLLYAVDAETGVERWQAQANGNPLSTPAVHSGVVYVNSNSDPGVGPQEGWAYAFDALTGAMRWRVEIIAKSDANPPVVGDGLVYVSGFSDPQLAESENESTLSALDSATGASVWSLTMPNGIGDPALANGVIYAGMYNIQELHAYDAKTGDLLWSVFTGTLQNEPVVIDGRIVASTSNDMLLVLGSPEDESTPVATAATPDASGLPPCLPTRPNLTSLPAGTPVASLPDTQPRTRGGLEIKVEDLPEGEPADAESVAAIEEVLGRIADCEQRDATSPIIPSGFFTDDFYRRATLEGRDFEEDFGSSLAPLLGGNGSSARSVTEVRKLPDGRFAATVMTSETTGYLLVFIEQDGLWLIDEYAAIVEIFDQTG